MPLSRRDFLAGAALAAVGAAQLGNASKAKGQEGANAVSITELGAKGDGQADDSGPIQRAINQMYAAPGGGWVIVPATDRFYKITRAIELQSDIDHPVGVVGEGDESFIKNVSTSMDHDFAPVFRVGRMVAGTSQYSASGQGYVDMAWAEKGATVIKPASGTYRRGDMVLIAGGPRQFHGERTEDWFPTYPQIAIVTDVDSAGVHISDGLLDAQPNAQVANYPFGVSHGVVTDLRLEQQNMGRLIFGVFAGGGAYRMRFLRVNVTRGVSFMACNGIAGCYFEDVFGRVIKKGLEFARYSHSTTVSRATFRILPESNEAGIMLYVPEASHRILFADCDVDVRGKVPLANDTTQLAGIFGASGFTAGSRFSVLRRTKILADRFSKGFSITGTTDRPTMGNEIEDSTITADNSEIPLRISTPGPDDKTGRHVVTGSRIEGRGASASIVIAADTKECTITNNVLPQGVKNLGGPTNTIENNTWS